MLIRDCVLVSILFLIDCITCINERTVRNQMITPIERGHRGKFYMSADSFLFYRQYTYYHLLDQEQILDFMAKRLEER